MIGFTRIAVFNGEILIEVESKSLAMLDDKKMIKGGGINIQGVLYIPKSIKYYKHGRVISKQQFKKEIKATWGDENCYDPTVYVAKSWLKKAPIKKR